MPPARPGVEASTRSPINKAVRDLTLPHDVEVEPVAAAGISGFDLFDGCCPQRGRGEGNARSSWGSSSCNFTLGLHETSKPRWSDAEGQRREPAEDLSRGVDVPCGLEDIGMKLNILRRLPGTPHRYFALGSAVGVVERSCRCASLGYAPQILCGECGVQTMLLAVDFGLLELQKFKDLSGLGKLAVQSTEPF